MRLIIVRHGETIENLQGICQGQMDGTLSPNGIIQVKLIADRLQNETIDLLFSSDLKRAVDTLAGIHKHHAHIPLSIDTRLRERYFGSFQGERFPANKKNMALPDDAENNESLHQRVYAFINEMVNKHAEQTILVVSHGVTIRMLLAVTQNLPPSSVDSIKEVMNGSITIIDYQKGKSPKFILHNSAAHLRFSGKC